MSAHTDNERSEAAVNVPRFVRPFAELSKAEREAMSDEEWNAVPPEEKRSCHDCRHLKAAVSWWCGNEDAIKFRGTSIPGVCLCRFWEPKPPRPRGFLEWLKWAFFRTNDEPSRPDESA